MTAISVTTSYLLSKSRRGTTGCLTEQPGYHKRCILVSAGRVVCGSGSHRSLLWSFRFAQVLSLCMFLFVHHSERCYFFTGTLETSKWASVLTVFYNGGSDVFRVRGELKNIGHTGCLHTYLCCVHRIPSRLSTLKPSTLSQTSPNVRWM